MVKIMSMNEPSIESFNLFNRLVEISWYFMATKRMATSSERRKFVSLMEKEIKKEGIDSNVIFVEDRGDIYICMVFRAKNIIKKVVIDVLDPNRAKPIEPNFQSGNVYIYGASGTIFQPTINNSFLDIENSEKTVDFDS